MRLADSHAHLSDKRFDPDRDLVLERARRAGVSLMIDVAVDVQTSEKAIALAAANGGSVRATVGVHPHHADTVDDDTVETLTALAGEPSVVAIGEIGLDFYRDLSPREKQQAAFVRQLELAAELNKPVVVHCRDSSTEVLELLSPWVGKLNVVMHCFSADEHVLRRALDMGYFVSFAGVITYPNATGLRALVPQVPLERLLIETDCPYLAPAPMRGRRNEPAYVRHVAQALAEIYDLPVEELADITFENTESFFGLAETSDHN